MPSFSIREVQALGAVFDALSGATGDALKEAFELQERFDKVCNAFERGRHMQSMALAADLQKALRKSCFWQSDWV